MPNEYGRLALIPVEHDVFTSAVAETNAERKARYQDVCFDQIEIDSDIFKPADGWSVTVYNMGGLIFPALVTNEPVQLVEATTGQIIMTGFIDTVDEHWSGNQHLLEIAGRDLAGWLLDCSLPLEKSGYMALPDLLQYYVMTGTPVPAVTLPPVEAWRGQKNAVEPGESIWVAIQKAAEAHGLYAWMTPSGTLQVGNPFDPSSVNNTPPQPPVLTFRRDGRGNNVLAVRRIEDGSDLYSEIQVLGQTPQGSRERTGGSFSATKKSPLNSQQTLANDRAPDFRGGSIFSGVRNRLRIVVDPYTSSNADATARAEKIMADSRMNSRTVMVTVPGWLVDGRVWSCGWSVRIDSDILPASLGRDFVIVRRTLIKNDSMGTVTELHLKQAGLWAQPVPYANKVRHVLTDAEKAARKAQRKAAAAAKRKANKGKKQSAKQLKERLRQLQNAREIRGML